MAGRYLRFAAEEAEGRSPLYADIARHVAADGPALDFLATLPVAKQQPNLLLAAVRHVSGTPAGGAEFRQALIRHAAAIRAVMLTRSTQTNEPARCATLLPILAGLPQPLALIEVGASAGLCLLPDHYGYDYGMRVVPPPGAGPILSCRANPATPLPTALPQVVWRAGLDLNPLDVTDPSDTSWLETLVWPEQTDRLARLRAALQIAAVVRPRVVAGDLRRDLARLAAEAPRTATLVIFHTAVLAYVASRADRDAFATTVQSLCPVWISNEAPEVFPAAGVIGPPGRFVLAVNGRPLAWTDPHGAAIEWLD